MAASGPELQERLLQVDINQQELNETVLVLEDESGELYLSASDLQRWRIQLPDTRDPVLHLDQLYYPLTAIEGLSSVLDPRNLTLMLDVRSDAFTATARVAQYAPIPAPVRSGAGGFGNYDLFAAHAEQETQLSGQFELGYFNRLGVGTGNVLVDDLASGVRVTRLDTTWTMDIPDTQRSLHIGDAVTRPGTWGRSVRFGGIQYGVNFATQPGFVTFPAQSVVGQAVLPSTIDVFVNNALVSQQTVPPGPFSISNLPVVAGGGELQLVVRDLFGREQLITQPFYSSQLMLREGLSDFSFELGAIRENFGINSFDYGDRFGAGTYRRGLSERLTGEIHVEAMQGQATAGGGGDYVLPQIGTFSLYAAGSSSGSNNGAMLQLGIDRQTRPWSLGARTQWMSRGFSQIGAQIGQPLQKSPPIRSSSFNISYAAGAGSAIGIAYVSQRNRDQRDVRVATLSYSISLGKWASFSVSAIRNFADDGTINAFATLTIPLSMSTSLSVSSQAARGGDSGKHNDFNTTLQSNLPRGEGYGYRVIAGGDNYREASYTLQNNVGTYTAGAARSLGTTATRVGVAGGVAVLGGDPFLSRRIDQSFAIARIADYPNVRILADNQPAGRTDRNGNALIPHLRAYDRNEISVDQRDLPLDAEIGTLKIAVVPYFRSGIEVIFPIKRSHGATLSILLENGSPLPLGAQVQRIGHSEIYMVGYEGQVYVDDLGPVNRLRVSWDDQSCEFDVPFAASVDPLPDLGTFICMGASQ